MNKLAIAILSSALISSTALAAPETYVIDNNHTFPSFSYSHFGFSVQTSRFDRTSGTVVLDKAARTGSVDVTIDMKSVDTGSALFNGDIQGEDFLDTARYPTATFRSTQVRFDGDKPVAIEGNLTMKGITKPVTLKITAFKAAPHPMAKRDAIGASASAMVKRTDFNAGKYAPNVGDDVTINIAIEAIKK